MKEPKLIQICPIPGNRTLDAVFERFDEKEGEVLETVLPIYHFAIIEVYDDKGVGKRRYVPIVFEFDESFSFYLIPQLREDFSCFQVDGNRFYIKNDVPDEGPSKTKDNKKPDKKDIN
jgi:hypothetical protein